jgi:hypothetical protein
MKMATAKGVRTPWTVFKLIPSHASEPYNSRKIIHCLEILFVTTKFEYNLQLIRGPDPPNIYRLETCFSRAAPVGLKRNKTSSYACTCETLKVLTDYPLALESQIN